MLIALMISASFAQTDLDYLNKMLSDRLGEMNAMMQKMISTPINLFGVDQKSLDPLQFGTAVTAQSGGDVCTGQKCVTVFGKDICTPNLCARGKAFSTVRYLTGLKSFKVNFVRFANFTVDGDTMQIDAVGAASLSAGTVNMECSVGIEAGLMGINIPATVNGYIGLDGPRPSAQLTMKITPTPVDGNMIVQIDKINLDSFLIGYNEINVGFDSFPGFLNSLISEAATGMKNLVSKFINIDGKISTSIVAAVNSKISAALPEINKNLKLKPIPLMPPSEEVVA